MYLAFFPSFKLDLPEGGKEHVEHHVSKAIGVLKSFKAISHPPSGKNIREVPFNTHNFRNKKMELFIEIHPSELPDVPSESNLDVKVALK